MCKESGILVIWAVLRFKEEIVMCIMGTVTLPVPSPTMPTASLTEILPSEVRGGQRRLLYTMSSWPLVILWKFMCKSYLFLN